jgi:hypothetical protein
MNKIPTWTLTCSKVPGSQLWRCLEWRSPRKDSTIFRRIAEILDGLPQGNAKDIDFFTFVPGVDFTPLRFVPGGDLTPLRFVVKARASLESDVYLKRVPRTDVTKKKVRLLAMRMWAIARLNAQGKMNRSSRLTPAKREKLIKLNWSGSQTRIGPKYSRKLVATI